MNSWVLESPNLCVLDRVEGKLSARNGCKRSREATRDPQDGVEVPVVRLGHQAQRTCVVEVEPVRQRLVGRKGIWINLLESGDVGCQLILFGDQMRQSSRFEVIENRCKRGVVDPPVAFWRRPREAK